MIARSLLALLGLALVLVACSGQPSPPTGAAACPPVAVSGPDGQPLDLSGIWSGNDGGIYYIKQIDSCVWWSGMSYFVDSGQYPGQEWIMTFRGTIDGEGFIRGDFVDVKSSNPGSGTLTIQARIDQESGRPVVNLYRMDLTGSQIGVTFWRPLDAEPTPAPTAQPS
jgi:hypothetical protein